MKILLKSRWKSKMSIIKLRVYLLGNNSYYLIDKTFDKKHYQDWLKFITNYILFSFSIFVIWRTNAKGKKKSSIVVNIRKLNKIVFHNFYPFLFQFEIITNIQGCTNLAIFNLALFFYQYCYTLIITLYLLLLPIVAKRFSNYYYGLH